MDISDTVYKNIGSQLDMYDQIITEAIFLDRPYSNRPNILILHFLQKLF